MHTLVDHIDHIVKIAGIDHVGIGSDYDGVTKLPAQLEDVSTYPYITQELLEPRLQAGRHSQDPGRKLWPVRDAAGRASEEVNPFAAPSPIARHLILQRDLYAACDPCD